jgi:hypothetical protein
MQKPYTTKTFETWNLTLDTHKTKKEYIKHLSKTLKKMLAPSKCGIMDEFA